MSEARAPNQGIGRAMLPLKVPGKDPSLSLPSLWWWLAVLGLLGL